MRTPVTRYGWPQVVVYPGVAVIAMVVFPLLAGSLPFWIILLVESVLAVGLIWAVAFFRDPRRRCPSDANLLLAPADGRITDLQEVQENTFIGGAALRIGIFLSIFDVHINRAPCDVRVEAVTYKKGRYKNAMNPESGRVNESNDLGLVRTGSPEDKLVVRQISGAIARRIVCEAAPGKKLAAGQKFGMIKFGSRTELYVPVRANSRCLVRVGNKVKAGLTPLIRYEM
jgi:phosphatidylserine decarboxylase